MQLQTGEIVVTRIEIDIERCRLAESVTIELNAKYLGVVGDGERFTRPT